MPNRPRRRSGHSRTAAPTPSPIRGSALTLAALVLIGAPLEGLPRDAPNEWTALSPGLRIDRVAQTVEFDATVALDCHNPTTPDAYLELIACAPDTREHEALVVTSVTPSLIHAALLAAGATPGAPGDLATGAPPTGDAISIAFITEPVEQTSGQTARRATAPRAAPVPATNWITDAPTRSRRPTDTFVFAGSRIVERRRAEVYDADGTGVILGLATFGSEVVAFVPLISPAATIDEPVWIADPRTTPTIGTPVRVRLSFE
jgi:hypothetical protein